jgi:hypothetical protein
LTATCAAVATTRIIPGLSRQPGGLFAGVRLDVLVQ